MFKCRVCAEKDKRIASLEEQVTFLRGFLRPKQEVKFDPLPVVELEADSVLAGHDEQIDPKRQAEIDAEAAAILAGTYN
jgi:hypothetical protein